MVDPNRKINRLTDKDIMFLDECEEEFSNRFTEDDEDFMDHCKNPLADPPIEDSWSSGNSVGHGNDRNNIDYRNRYNSGNHRASGWRRQRRGHSGDFNRHGRRNDYGGRNHDYAGDRSRRTSNQEHTPMNIRRDYGNFVAASENN